MISGCTMSNDGVKKARDYYENYVVERYHEGAFRADMLKMTDSLRTILVVAVDDKLETDEQRTHILTELDTLQELASAIDDDGEVYSYTNRNPYMGSFLHDIDMAREFASDTPPNFEPSRKLINSCLFCHKSL
jgi:hypothetical protein